MEHVCGPDMTKIKGCRNIVFNIFISEAFVTVSSFLSRGWLFPGYIQYKTGINVLFVKKDYFLWHRFLNELTLLARLIGVPLGQE